MDSDAAISDENEFVVCVSFCVHVSFVSKETLRNWEFVSRSDLEGQ
jgi:hypothetical protein